MPKPLVEVELVGGPRDGERFETTPALEYWASSGERWAIYRPRRLLNRLYYAGSILKSQEKAYENGELEIGPEGGDGE